MNENGQERQSIAGQAVALLALPAVLVVCAVSGTEFAAVLSLAAVCAVLLASAVSFERGSADLSSLMPTVTLAALAAAGRILFAPFPDVKPVSAIAIVAGAALGPKSGFAVGALAALTSNFFFGQGAYTPWQMYAWGLVGWLGGVLAVRGVFKSVRSARVFGFASALLYGAIMNSWHIIGFVRPLTPATALAAFVAGLPLDLVHGAATVVFLSFIWDSWGRKIRRVVARY